MAGLLKPYAAQKLVKALREEIGVPIHFHTHDSAGGQIASYLLAAEEGVDIVDCAFAPLAGLTSQPSLNALVEALRFTERDTGMDFDALQADRGLLGGSVRKPIRRSRRASLRQLAEVYLHEMPGGQYANLYQQAQSLGVGDRWHEVGRTYAAVNQLFGDIVKVTPTSKVVGDMALFMLANNLTPEQVLDPKREIAFPESVVEFFEGKLGQPPGGFPPALQKRVLRGRKPLTDRPGATLAARRLRRRPKRNSKRSSNGRSAIRRHLVPALSAGLRRLRGPSRASIPTSACCRRASSSTACEPGEEISVDIEPGKTLIIKFLTVGDPHDDGRRLVFFELNGQPREVLIRRQIARSATARQTRRTKAEPGNPAARGAPDARARSSASRSAVGEEVAAGQKLLTLEAMKMETTLYAERAGTDRRSAGHVAGTQVEGGDLVIRLE